MATFDRDALCARMAEAQHGVFNLAQAIRAGHDHCSIHRRLRSGRWRLVLPTVFRFAGVPLSREGYYMAGAIWDAGRAFVSGPSAADLHGLSGFADQRLEISTVGNRNRPVAELRVRRVHPYA